MSRKGNRKARYIPKTEQIKKDPNLIIKSLESFDFQQLDNLSKLIPAYKEAKLQKSLYSGDEEDIVKANMYLQAEGAKAKQSEGKSFMFLPDDYGYTGKGYKDTLKGVSFDALQRMGDIFIVRSIVNTRVEQVQNFLKFELDEQKEGFTIRKKKSLFEKERKPLTAKERLSAEKIVTFLEDGGFNDKWDSQDSFQDFIRKIVRDSLVLDQLSFETVRNRKNELVKYKAIDASLIRLLDSIDPRYREQFSQMEKNGHLPRYCMAWNSQILKHPTTGQPILYYPWELGYGVRNKTTNVRKNGYGVSELETLMDLVTYILWGVQYNGNFFKQGSQPKGFINVKNGNVDNTTLNEFRNSWRQTMAGVHNCLAGNTHIITKEGRVNLEDFFLENDEDKYVDIWTGKKFEKGLVYKSGKKVLNRIKLNNGMSIDSSPEHRFKTVDESGDIVWKKRSELKVGDFLMVNKSSINESRDILYYKGQEVESDLLEVIGWMVGDGWFGSNEPSKKRCSLFYHQDRERNIQYHHSYILDKYNINNLVEEHFYTEEESDRIKENYKFKNVAESNLRTFTIDSDFFEFLMSLGFKSSKDGKNIPDFLFSCNSKYRRAFLRGYFSADCHVSAGRYIQMSIVNDNLRQRTKELLLCEGIRCGNHEGKERKNTKFGTLKAGYRILIKDNDLFFERVGLVQEYKKFKNNEFAYYSVKESFPHSMCKKQFSLMREDIREKFKGTGRSLCCQKVTYAFNAALTDKEVFTFNRFKSIYDIVKNHSVNYSINTEILDFHFEKIIELEEYDAEVDMYDVQIFDNENQFIANGILSHNSHKVPVIQGLDMEWIDLHHSNRDMEFTQWIEFLIVMFCSVYTIDPSELGFNFKQQAQPFGQEGQQARLEHSKNKGLKPLLRFLEGIVNKFLVSELDEGLEFAFTGIDIEDEAAQVDIDDKKLKAGMISFEKTFEKYEGEKYDPKKHTILNQIHLQLQQSKQFGGEESNQAVDEMTGEPEEGAQNPFAEFEKAGQSDPIISAALSYVNDCFKR